MTDTSINTRMTAREWLMLISLSLLWGGSFFFNGVAVQELPTITIVVGRVGIAAIMLWVVVYAVGQRMPGDFQIWKAFLFMGLLNNALPFSLIVWGQAHIASGVASILNATTPLFTVVVAHFLTTDEKISPLRLGGIGIGFSGVVFIVADRTGIDLDLDVLAILACLGASLSYGFAGVYGRRFRTLGVQPVTVAAGQVTASTIMLMPLMLTIDRPWTMAMPSGDIIAAMIALAGLSTALAYILFFRILQTAGATNLLLVTFLIPLSAIGLGIAFLGEVIETRHLVGLALISAGLVAIDGRVFSRGQAK